MREMSLNDLALFLGRALARQSPVAGMSEGVNKNVVRQFLMPGYPLVIVTTMFLEKELTSIHSVKTYIITEYPGHPLRWSNAQDGGSYSIIGTTDS